MIPMGLHFRNEHSEGLVTLNTSTDKLGGRVVWFSGGSSAEFLVSSPTQFPCGRGSKEEVIVLSL